MNKTIFLIGSLLLVTNLVSGQQEVLGTWKTIDDGTGEAKSHVTLSMEDNQLTGTIVKILSDDPDALCSECSGNKANKPILGMQIIEKMEANGSYWDSGKILDPESGSTYKCKIWVDDQDQNILNVRGIHWTGLYRTQTWHRVQN